MIYDDIRKDGDFCFDIGANIGNRVDMFINLNYSKIILDLLWTKTEQ